MLRRNRILLVLGIIVVLAVALRAALPFMVRDYMNRKLASLESYQGSVADVDIALWRGAYGLDGVQIVKREGSHQTPFFSAPRIDISVEWRNLFKGSVVAEAKFLQPQVNLVQSKNEKEEQLGKEVNWADSLKELVPIRLNTVAVQDGTVTFRTPGIATNDALVAHNVSGTVSNLTNVVEQDKETFADFAISANVLQGGVTKDV